MQLKQLYASALWATASLAAYSSVPSRYETSGDSIRYKKFADGTLCNGGTEHYTGWADIGDKHLFYWYHPTRSSDRAPLLIWLQGGPGGTSMMGQFVENGPCVMDLDTNYTSTVFNPYSWSQFYNVIYLDQPVTVGYSYKSNASSPLPRHAEQSAVDFVRALRLVPDAFPELQGLPIYIAGESYAGRWIPVYGAAVLEYNRHVATPADRIPLKSIMVGNGLTNFKEQMPSLYDVGCFTVDGIAPIFNETLCNSMAAAVDRCERLSQACETNSDDLICGAALKFCSEELWLVVDQTLANRYNRVQQCKAAGECYDVADRLEDLMNSKAMRDALEIESETSTADHNVTFGLESKAIMDAYMSSGDVAVSSVPALKSILESSEVDVLYYVGIQDWICNSVGMRRMLDALQWRGHARFRAIDYDELSWKNNRGESAGRFKAVPGLHYVELAGAGHLVCDVEKPLIC